VVFYANEEQRKTTEEIIQGLDKSRAFSAPIVTELAALTVFYKAEGYHQNYYNENKSKNSYCAIVIVPKIEKFEKYFADRLKK
jgi:peptide methionine sulfoxide reductase MsrA